MDIRLETNLPQVQKELDDLVRRKLPRATLNAVNDLAFDVREQIREDMRATLDRPTPFALNMFEVLKGRDVNRPEAMVRITDDYRKNETFKHLFTDGPRTQKRMERRLIAAGIMRPGEIAVPGGGAPLDRYGNLRGSFVTMLLSYFQTLEMGNMNAAGRARRAKKTFNQKKGYWEIRGTEYFISFGPSRHDFARHQPLPRGIWSRRSIQGFIVSPVILFVKAGTYRRFFDLQKIADDVVRANRDQRLVNRLSRAIAGALGDRA